MDGEEQRKFGIKLEEPKLIPPQITSPQVPKVVKQRTVGGQGGGGIVRQNKRIEQTPQPQQADQQIQPQQADQQKSQSPPFDPNYKPREPGLLSAPDLGDLIGFGLGAGATLLASRLGLGRVVSGVAGKVGGAIGKVKDVFSRTPKSAPQQVAGNVAKETAEKVASQQVKKEAQDVMGQVNKYDKRREELRKRIEEQMKRFETERAERLKQLLEDYKAFQKQTEELERRLGLNKTTIEKIEEALKRTTDPQRKEQLKKLLEFRQKLEETERQLRKEYQDLIKKLQTKYAKMLKLEAQPVKPEQIEKVLKPHRTMPPKEQLLREEIHISSLKPLQTKREEIQKIDDIVKELLKPPQVPQPPKKSSKSKKPPKSRKKKPNK